MRTYILLLMVILNACTNSPQKTKPDTSSQNLNGTFSFTKTHKFAVPPIVLYDAITGGISPWWDHTFSEKPHKLYIEAKPGGGFYEIFTPYGDGVKHADVIYAHRGKLLRMDGPLVLSGKAIQLVSTYHFTPIGNDSTLFQLEVHGAGELANALPSTVEKVWEHFIFKRFVPYIESGKYKHK